LSSLQSFLRLAMHGSWDSQKPFQSVDFRTLRRFQSPKDHFTCLHDTQNWSADVTLYSYDWRTLIWHAHGNLFVLISSPSSQTGYWSVENFMITATILEIITSVRMKEFVFLYKFVGSNRLVTNFFQILYNFCFLIFKNIIISKQKIWIEKAILKRT